MASLLVRLAKLEARVDKLLALAPDHKELLHLRQYIGRQQEALQNGVEPMRAGVAFQLASDETRRWERRLAGLVRLTG